MLVEGHDMNKNPVRGEIIGEVSAFGVVLVKTGEDRLDITHCHQEDLKEIENK